MKELEQILRLHAQRYRHMEPTDVVKLIYQNEFGGGHLIRDEKAVLEYLRREYASVVRDPAMPKTEPIGNGLVRVHLAALQPDEIEQLGQNFIAGAAVHRGNGAMFEQKLQLLEQLTAEGIFSFPPEVLKDYLSDYRNRGCPMVSHSQTYRSHYHPAYRIVKV